MMILRNIIFLISFNTSKCTGISTSSFGECKVAYYHSMEGLNYWTLYYLNGDTTVNQTTYHVLNIKKWYNPNSNPNILEYIYQRRK